MNTLSSLLRPTLVRRATLALLPAALVVWCVLIAFYFWRETRPEVGNKRLQAVTSSLQLALAKSDTPDRASLLASTFAEVIEANMKANDMPARMIIQVDERHGKLVYTSAPGVSLSSAVDEGAIVERHIDATRFRVMRVVSGSWSIYVAEPAIDASWLLARLSANLTMSVIITFPFVLLPTWFAIRRGLQPLTTLSRLIQSRGPDDLKPLGMQAQFEELKPVVSAIEELLAQLRSTIAREHAFVQDAAHELRTPLAVIAAQAHVLAAADDVNERKQAQKEFELAVARVSNLIAQLLDLARVESIESNPLQQCDLAQLLQQELAAAAPMAMQRGIDLSMDAPDAFVCALDRRNIESIIRNLLSNALKYVHDGGRVLVVLVVEQGHFRLSVADNGIGISLPNRALVFQRFYRVAGHSVTGSGLGLSIVATAASKLGGTVSLGDGLDGQGCTFAVQIPIPTSKESHDSL